MPAKKIDLKPVVKALKKTRNEVKKHLKGATPTQAAVLKKEITEIDEAIKNLIKACHAGFNVG